MPTKRSVQPDGPPCTMQYEEDSNERKQLPWSLANIRQGDLPSPPFFHASARVCPSAKSHSTAVMGSTATAGTHTWPSTNLSPLQTPNRMTKWNPSKVRPTNSDSPLSRRCRLFVPDRCLTPELFSYSQFLIS